MTTLILLGQNRSLLRQEGKMQVGIKLCFFYFAQASSLLPQEGTSRPLVETGWLNFSNTLSKPNTMSEIHNRKYLKQFRRDLRNNLTSVEVVLWNHLKGKSLGRKFRRQHSAGNFILDFYCATERIAIELDGAHHFTDEGMKYDEERTRYLNSLNIKVIRFENVRVFEDLEGVLKEIRACVNHPDSAGAESVPPEAGGKK